MKITMKVKELIEKLNTFDPDLDVFLNTYTNNGEIGESSLGIYDVRLDKYEGIDKNYVEIVYDYSNW